jgi:hypothetical protein
VLLKNKIMNKQNRFIRSLYNPLSINAHKAWALLFPGSYAKYLYKKIKGEKPNLKNPQGFYEKNLWLRIYSDTAEWTRLADKYQVRDFVKKCGLENILINLYGVWDKADEIDFTKLPEKFVLKTNNRFGRNLLVKNKHDLNFKMTQRKLSKWINEKYGLVTMEPHCWRIPPKILAEEYLEDDYNTIFSSSLIDYKFYCFHGEPDKILVVCDRKNETIGELENFNQTKKFIFDLDWNFRPDLQSNPPKPAEASNIPKPKNFDEMVSICRILSSQFPFVRVDLYEVNNKVYFGELTFTPGGHMALFTHEYFLEMGKKIDLSTVKRRKIRAII